MYTNRFQRNARQRRTKAVVFTILINVALISGLLLLTNGEASLAEFVQSLFESEATTLPAERP